MSQYAVDSNIISFIMRGDRHLQNRVYREADEGEGVIIPPITYYEVKRGLIDCNSKIKLDAFKRLCDKLGVDDMDMETLDTAADIYVKLKQAGCPIGDSDVLIAATCLTSDYTLITDNTRHFERVEGLQLVNWIER